MSLTLYAIAKDVPQQRPVQLTVQRTHLRALAADGLVMFVADQAAPRADTDERALWRYERIIEELMQQQSILPARYGTVLADEEAARAALLERRDELAQRLEEVRDAVELAVRATSPQERQSQRTEESGREYMLSRLQAQRDAERIAARLDPLRSLARRSVVRLLPRPAVLLLAAYLVDRDAVACFSERFQSLSADAEDAVLSCTGPWPPYSFAQGGAI